ncbi:MAG: hypothetical protein JXQ81_00685 [Desulfuromonadales bacterium]|nr:hypothetical protein [Desulfuromonadales bacterium]MBN2791000.1 hypothetical protein [Desulfuromonadales bacterium]
MLSYGRRGIFLLLLFSSLLVFCTLQAQAGEKEERIRELQEKMQLLKQQLAVMQEQKLREQPPQEIPWQPLLELGQERPAYRQYAYLLGAQMSQEELDSVLQQAYFLASQDSLEERGTLFLVPTLQLSAGQQMSVDSYNRDLAGRILRQAGVPTAIEGGLLVTAAALTSESGTEEIMLFIDLAGSDQILRSRIFELLSSQRLFTEGGSIHNFIWDLVQNASPQVFSIFRQGNLAWLVLDSDE